MGSGIIYYEVENQENVRFDPDRPYELLVESLLAVKRREPQEIYHPLRPPALNKKYAHQVQLSNEDKVEGKRSEEAKERVKKGKGLRHTPPHIKKKKKDPMKKKVKIRNQGEGSSKEKGEEEKRRRKIELRCASMDDLIRRLQTFKKAFHNNDAMNTQ
ncbi:hypothetical protein PIB30_044133 [Stylosanthes scabra]|uniref:Uncharacterized protein n=1 Tax=Stylosanthes scabra TaxID=79078 RepID=A0ABU6TFE0_9FABA|nr:hypothetical protein [Stylosanthes scabra]